MLFSQTVDSNQSLKSHFLLYLNWVAFTKPFKQNRITKGGGRELSGETYINLYACVPFHLIEYRLNVKALLFR